MQPTTTIPPEKIPLCVDLDGTFIRTDMMWVSLRQLLRKNPLMAVAALFWWMHGRAYLKQQLAARVEVDPARLPYSQEFIAWLQEQKNAGRSLILVTASDMKMARLVANYVGLFDDVLASDGKTNLRGANKLKTLIDKFGERGFDYAGNSSVDLAVWKGAREAIIVNGSKCLAKRAAKLTKVGRVFPR